MINSFKDNEVRDSALVYNGTWEQIKKLYATNPQQAGELAISAIEMALTGDISSDDFLVGIALENMRVVAKKNKDKWDKECDRKRTNKITALALDKIAELYLQKIPQTKIGQELNIPQQTVSYRLNIIRKEFPELLKGEQDLTNSTNFTNIGNFSTNGTSSTNNPTYDTDTVTDTDTDTVTDTVTDTSLPATREISKNYQKMSVTEIDKMLVENDTEEIVYKDGVLTNYTTGEVIYLDADSQKEYDSYLYEWS